MEYFIGKKLYELLQRSYEGEIGSRDKGVNGKLSYIGKINEIKGGWITFIDNKRSVSINDLNKGFLFLDLEEILSESN